MQNTALRKVVSSNETQSNAGSSSKAHVGAEVSNKLRLLRKAKESGIAQRRYKRFPCSTVGVFTITNRSISLEGMVTEISKNGVKFRPASVFLLDRKGVSITIAFEEFQFSGKVVATRSDGYGIALFEEIEDKDLQGFLSRQRIRQSE